MESPERYVARDLTLSLSQKCHLPQPAAAPWGLSKMLSPHETGRWARSPSTTLPPVSYIDA